MTCENARFSSGREGGEVAREGVFAHAFLGATGAFTNAAVFVGDADR
jgi:hypothetical protein